MSLPHISPADAKRLIDQGAVLVDIRERDEHARERIVGATSAPLSLIQEHDLTGHEGRVMIFHCKSGNRTKVNAQRLAGETPCNAFILDGGIEAWKAAGLPIHRDGKPPIEISRQVQIAAGGPALAGALLGYFINPGFYALSGAIGAGLMFSGITGTCAMARVLKRMPWNRAVA
jgi:rhodanese-related sulfurtransferase